MHNRPFVPIFDLVFFTTSMIWDRRLHRWVNGLSYRREAGNLKGKGFDLLLKIRTVAIRWYCQYETTFSKDFKEICLPLSCTYFWKTTYMYTIFLEHKYREYDTVGVLKRSSGSLTPWCFWTLCDHDLNAYWDQFQAVNGSFCGIKRQVSIAWYRLIKRRNADTYTRLILFAWKAMYKPFML